MNTSDIVILDDLLPKSTCNRFTQYVTDPMFEWNDFNHIQTSGVYFKEMSFSSEHQFIARDALIKLAYFNNFRDGDRVFDKTTFWLAMAIMDEYARRTGEKVTDIMRVKLNNQTRSNNPNYDTNTHNEIHIDHVEYHKTIVYYINDSDGDTFLFDQKYDPNRTHYDCKTVGRVTPKQNRLVCFDGLRYHAPSNPVYYPRRYIMNINFI